MIGQSLLAQITSSGRNFKLTVHLCSDWRSVAVSSPLPALRAAHSSHRYMNTLPKLKAREMYSTGKVARKGAPSSSCTAAQMAKQLTVSL